MVRVDIVIATPTSCWYRVSSPRHPNRGARKSAPCPPQHLEHHLSHFLSILLEAKFSHARLDHHGSTRGPNLRHGQTTWLWWLESPPTIQQMRRWTSQHIPTKANLVIYGMHTNLVDRRLSTSMAIIMLVGDSYKCQCGVECWQHNVPPITVAGNGQIHVLH